MDHGEVGWELSLVPKSECNSLGAVPKFYRLGPYLCGATMEESIALSPLPCSYLSDGTERPKHNDWVRAGG